MVKIHYVSSESVTEGHPDKVCDQISDAILDSLIVQDPGSRTAVECLTTTGLVVVAGEVTTSGYADIQMIARNTLKEIGSDIMTGDYACWNYFQSINTVENQKFVKEFKKKYGEDRVISDPMEAAYIGVKLWAMAVEAAKSDTNIHAIREQLSRHSLVVPEGFIHASFESNHLWKLSRIGKIRDDGQFEIVWESERLKKPMPFPDYKVEEEWLGLLQDLFDV